MDSWAAWRERSNWRKGDTRYTRETNLFRGREKHAIQRQFVGEHHASGSVGRNGSDRGSGGGGTCIDRRRHTEQCIDESTPDTLLLRVMLLARCRRRQRLSRRAALDARARVGAGGHQQRAVDLVVRVGRVESRRVHKGRGKEAVPHVLLHERRVRGGRRRGRRGIKEGGAICVPTHGDTRRYGNAIITIWIVIVDRVGWRERRRCLSVNDKHDIHSRQMNRNWRARNSSRSPATGTMEAAEAVLRLSLEYCFSSTSACVEIDTVRDTAMVNDKTTEGIGLRVLYSTRAYLARHNDDGYTHIGGWRALVQFKVGAILLLDGRCDGVGG